MNDAIKEIIKKYEVSGDFTRTPYDPAIVSAAEKVLGFNLDESYITFIKEYGHGGIGGIEIMGIGKNNVLISADETMSCRESRVSAVLIPRIIKKDFRFPRKSFLICLMLKASLLKA